MRLVLDTNVVIDWLVFCDPYMDPLRSAVAQRRVEIVTHAPAIEEFRRVLGYPELKVEEHRRGELLRSYAANTQVFSALSGELPRGFPRCRDSDDDPFIALAWLSQASALVSRDRQVLKLRRKCRKFAVRILDVQELIAELTPCD